MCLGPFRERDLQGVLTSVHWMVSILIQIHKHPPKGLSKTMQKKVQQDHSLHSPHYHLIHSPHHHFLPSHCIVAHRVQLKLGAPHGAQEPGSQEARWALKEAERAFGGKKRRRVMDSPGH